VLGSSMVEDEAIYLWLSFASQGEPRAYALPWSEKLARQLHKAEKQGEASGRKVLMRRPFGGDFNRMERVFYPEIEKLLLEFFPGSTDAIVYNHDVFDKHYEGDRTEDQAAKNPGVNANYANLVHNDLNDNSGRVRCRELLTQNLRNFGRELHYTEAEADAKMSRRFMSINLAKPMETVRQNPFVLCAWPSFADQPYITNYRIYDDRVGETTRFTYRPDHEWYWFPEQTPTEVSMLKCYDSVADGSVSRWSFHTACIDPTAPADAPCRKNVVVRSYVFF